MLIATIRPFNCKQCLNIHRTCESTSHAHVKVGVEMAHTNEELMGMSIRISLRMMCVHEGIYGV